MSDVYQGNLATMATSFFMATSASLPMSASGLNPIGINFNEMSSTDGDNSIGLRPMFYGMKQNLTDGSPGSPCLELELPSFYRFRWVVRPGQRSISVRAKQCASCSVVNQRPSVVIKSNTTVGLMNDVSGSAPDSVDWVTIGPVSFTSTGTDSLWVELHNNLYITSQSAYFDHIVVT